MRGATQTDRQPFQGVTMSRTYLVRAAAATLIGAALLSAAVDTPAQASTRTEFTPTHTLGSGPLCGGTVHAVASTHPLAPGTATVFLRAALTTYFAPSPVWTCLVRTTVHYRNPRTGATGSRSVTLSTSSQPRIMMCTPRVGGGLLCGTTAELKLHTGGGWVDAWVTTALPHIAGTARLNTF